MAKLDNPQAGAQKWADKMAGSTQAYKDGVQGVQTAPGQKAARASGKWLAKTQAAQPKFEKNVGAVSLQEWQTSAIEKGSLRLASGATAALPKMERFNAAFYQYLKAGQATIEAMPTDTIEQSLQKANAQAMYNHRFPGYR